MYDTIKYLWFYVSYTITVMKPIESTVVVILGHIDKIELNKKMLLKFKLLLFLTTYSCEGVWEQLQNSSDFPTKSCKSILLATFIQQNQSLIEIL